MLFVFRAVIASPAARAFVAPNSNSPVCSIGVIIIKRLVDITRNQNDEVPRLGYLLHLSGKTSPVLLGILRVIAREERGGDTEQDHQCNKAIHHTAVTDEGKNGFVGKGNPDKIDRGKDDEIPGHHRDLVGKEPADGKGQEGKCHEKDPFFPVKKECLGNSHSEQDQEQVHCDSWKTRTTAGKSR